MYFLKKVYAVTIGSGAYVGEFLVTFNCKLQKNVGAGCTSCSPNNFVLPMLPGSRAYAAVTESLWSFSQQPLSYGVRTSTSLGANYSLIVHA